MKSPTIIGKLEELIFKRPGNKRRIIIALIFLFLVFILGIFAFLKEPKPQPDIPKRDYAEIFSLVSDKISQSAYIAINIPPNSNLSREDAQKNTKISPEIKGKWIETGVKNQIVFKPEEKMKIGKYYTVTMKSAEGNIGGDFLVVDDPKILAIFPKADSETNEESEITVIFNRPMTPITTLDALSDLPLPVEIQPKTEGKFKWTGTRTLQFIPKNRLIRSSNYYIKVKPEFVSMDGLGINGVEQKFKTRILRYEDVGKGVTVYNDPIRIKFNQPVDLEKTAEEITLINATFGKQADFTAEYGKNKMYNEETKKYDETEDRSVILIYNKMDRYGRAKFWDFANSYSLKIAKAYPEEGDIILNEPRQTDIQITDIVKHIGATSDRTGFAAPDFFDPQGKLWIEFYEDIDLGKSKFGGNEITKIEYGEKCKENGGDLYVDQGQDCEKETDKKKIYIVFDADKIKNSQNLKIGLIEIVNTNNLQINASTITEDVVAIPDFKILRTIPQNGANSADLSEFIICSNSPIIVPAKEDIASYIKISLDYEFKYWQPPVKIDHSNSSYYKCGAGEFETRINYGLMPENNYSLEIKAIDHFGRDKTIETGFMTGKMPEQYLNFHHLQKEYNVTDPDKTKLTYAVENMDYINLNICKLDAKDMLYYLQKGITYVTPPSAISGCKKTIQKKIDLPKRYWLKNYFKVDLEDYVENPLGHYILTFSHPNYKEKYAASSKQIYERTYLTVTNLGAVEKKIEINDEINGIGSEELSSKQKSGLKNIYWVTNLKTLDPVPKAGVRLFENVGNRPNLKLKDAGSYITDSSGVAETAAIRNLTGAIISNGEDSAIISDMNYDSKLQYGSSASSAQKIYLYTDRPIYRPGQEVFIKGLYRIGYDGDYEIFRENKIALKVFNSENKEIMNENVEVDDFGTFNSRLILDTKAPLGRFRIEAGNANTFFDVEEYVAAPFKVEAKSDKDEYISGGTFNLDIDASYYFGAPVEGGEVEYSIATQNYYFDKFSDEYFDFGIPWYYCYYDCNYGNYGDKFILRNKTSLNSFGKARISYNIDLKKLFAKPEDLNSKIFVVYATVKNSNGQAVSAQKSFIVHKGEYYLGVKTDKYFISQKESFNIKVKSVDTQGRELAVNNLNLKISKVRWEESKRKEVDGEYYYQWEKKLDLIEEKNISTDRKGNWKDDFSLDKEGEFEVSVAGTDRTGNTIVGNYSVYVYGESQVDVRNSNNEELEIVTYKKNLKVGDRAEIIIKSPYDRAKALISIERGRIFDYKIVDIGQNLYKYSFIVKPEYIPNFYVSAILSSSKPEVKFGKLEFQVDTDKKELNISSKSDKNSYLPGENVVLDFESKDSDGKPVETEFSVAVADLSVLALKGNPKKNPLVFFYGGFPLTVSTSSNLKNILYEINVPGESKGGGGIEPEDLAKKKRGEFKDTAFWQAVVRTNKDGKAQLKFKLPDNLTTWQVESIGISKDTKLGISYKDFVAKKNLMVMPLKPRFAVPGDEFSIGAKIFNQTDKKQSLKVTFSSDTLTMQNDESSKEIQINANETQTVYFKILADASKQDGEHKFVLSAKNGQYEDTVENSISITRNDTYEATATAGYSKDSKVDEYVYLPENISKDRGGLTAQSGATLAVFLSEALNYLLSYPYGCSEQIASKLDAIAVVKKGLNLKNVGDKFNLKDIEFEGQKYTADETVEIGLARIYENQGYGGGFSYYPGGEENFYLSLHIAGTLENLKDAGYSINENVLKKTFSYINNRLSYDGELQKDRDLVILAVNALLTLKEYGSVNDNLINYIKALEKDEAFLNEKISNISLATLAIIVSENQNIFSKVYKNKIFNSLENRIDIDSRGSFLSSKGSVVWQYYETPIKDTALLLKALVKDKRDNQILDRILRWILRSRSKDGAWGSTNNSITVVDALTDYLTWQRETESDFTLKTLLDGKEIQSSDFNAVTVLDQKILEVGIGEMKSGVINNLQFRKENHNELDNNFYYDVSLKYYLPIDKIPPRDEGFTISRNFYKLDDKKYTTPVTEAEVGDVLRGHIKLFVPAQRNFVAVEDFIPAGAELVNFNLETSDKSLQAEDQSGDNQESEKGRMWQSQYDDGKLHLDREESRDDRLFLFKENLPEGEYEFDYYVRVLVPGKFHHLPAMVSEMYFPENFARTKGDYFTIKQN